MQLPYRAGSHCKVSRQASMGCVWPQSQLRFCTALDLAFKLLFANPPTEGLAASRAERETLCLSPRCINNQTARAHKPLDAARRKGESTTINSFICRL